MIDPLLLLDACERCYAYPAWTAGPHGRDAASLEKIDGESVLVFRGTLTEGRAGFVDWLNDLRAELVYREDYPGLVHAGFAASVENLLPQLPVLGGRLTITGHSKGGALAVLMGLYLLHRQGTQSKIVTFGAPRVGNEIFTLCANDRLDIDSYQNPHDIVPKLPPVEYRNVGYLITPRVGWVAPRGVVENHSIETGYRPWIQMDQPPAQSLRRAA